MNTPPSDGTVTPPPLKVEVLLALIRIVSPVHCVHLDLVDRVAPLHLNRIILFPKKGSTKVFPEALLL